MSNPILWLGLSFALVAVSLMAVLITLIPVALQLSHTAHSAEKLLDTLNREFPDALESLKATNTEITELTAEIKEGVKGATSVTKQVETNVSQGISVARKQVNGIQVKSRGLWVGIKTGWQTWQNYPRE
ncbi:MAG: DUF948 domain-containing protein [Cyanobacterium sp. T60_A2020_053]|nr:DUF948 domain-containing protein [Cyanobacterium sp. T60_A2020_053]